MGVVAAVVGVVLGVGVSVPAAAASGSGFSDIDEAGPHRGSVEALAAEGVLAGTECRPGVFCPTDPWSSPRWPDTSTKSAFDVREWTQRVGKEFCWEGIDRDASSRMSSNVDAVEIVRSSGKPIRQVATELGIYDSTLGNWVRQDGINRGEREGLTSDERERLREPGAGERPAADGARALKTSCGLLGAGVERVTLYRFVDAQKAEGFPVRLTCSVVGVSPSAYYAHKQRPQSGPAQLAEAALVDEIRTIWRQSGGTYGSPRVCAELGRRGRVVNHKREGAADERPPYGGFRSPQAACHHHSGHRSSDP